MNGPNRKVDLKSNSQEPFTEADSALSSQKLVVEIAKWQRVEY
jgi:hypothetical protein